MSAMPTIHDVAHRAGVSSTTVSRYLNHRIDLPAQTAARIDAAIEALGYRPNITAKRLSTGRTESIGMVVPDIREPIFAELAAAVEDEADNHGYTIYLSTTRSDPSREVAAIERLHDRHVDGLIIITDRPDDGTLARLIGTQQRPVVLLGEDIAGAQVPRVFLANEEGAHAATRHLIEWGHTDIAYIGGPRGLISATERLAGFRRAMAESGIGLRENFVHDGSYAPAFAQAATASLMRARRPPTAILAASDSLVLGAIMGLREAGLDIPRDVSLVGFDDVVRTRLLQPGLTSVRTPVSVLGREAFRALHDLMTGSRSAPAMRVPLELVRRNSVAAPAQRRLQ
jgi:LacI family transcriptional regulator